MGVEFPVEPREVMSLTLPPQSKNKRNALVKVEECDDMVATFVAQLFA